jgi:hypothetical protein
MTDDQHDTLDYLASVIADREQMEWFTDSISGADHVTGPMDVFVRTVEGAVTWGWSIQPIPVETAGRRFRRFVDEDDFVIIPDAEALDTVFVPHQTELHSISDGRHASFAAPVAVGAIPSASIAFDLEKAARLGSGRYSVDAAWPHDMISRALGLWVSSLLGADTAFTWRPLSDDDNAEIEQLTAPEQPGDDFAGFDAEIAELLSSFATIAWMQGDLTWPDAENVEAFRDHVDVRFRSPTDGLVYLASIGSLGSGDDPWIGVTTGGGLLSLDRSEPTTIGLAPDRTVFALSRQSDGYEPAGFASAYGVPPTADEWAELRTFASETPDAHLIHAHGWSEGVVADALSLWSRRWADADVSFEYDYEDSIAQAAIQRNEDLAEAPQSSNEFVRTDTSNRCGFTQPASVPNERPFPCGRPATHYFTPGETSDGVVLICELHVPDGISVSPLLK